MVACHSSFHLFFIQQANIVSLKSTCIRRKIGAVLVKNDVILATGYNGAPDGIPNCLETSCIRDKLGIPSGTQLEMCSAVHAEQMAILTAAREGISLDNSFLYCTCSPCPICARMIITCGISKVFYCSEYSDLNGLSILKSGNVDVQKIYIDNL